MRSRFGRGYSVWISDISGLTRFTSGYHFFARLICLVIIFVLWGVFGSIIAWACQSYLEMSKDNEIYYVYFPAAILSMVASFYLCRALQLDERAAYLYIRNELQTNVTFEEAKKLAFLFVEDSKGKWYPMKEVQQLPPEARKRYLFDRAAYIAEVDEG